MLLYILLAKFYRKNELFKLSSLWAQIPTPRTHFGGTFGFLRCCCDTSRFSWALTLAIAYYRWGYFGRTQRMWGGKREWHIAGCWSTGPTLGWSGYACSKALQWSLTPAISTTILWKVVVLASSASPKKWSYGRTWSTGAMVGLFYFYTRRM